MKYCFELNEEIKRCSNCPCVSVDIIPEDKDGNERDIYYCNITGQSAGYHSAQTKVMSQCPLIKQ